MTRSRELARDLEIALAIRDDQIELDSQTFELGSHARHVNLALTLSQNVRQSA